ncbi:hypothetical protein F5Y19DRAFT_461242 [Xylariaceae sp. FL1651]|nr:hypothetical protein F5Y19DRAFT_461242 [Xylariaceae sp. FL1651]
MMLFGTTRKEAEIRPEQKWDAISLRDFKTSSIFPPLAYGYLYFSLLLSLAVYGVDIFTAINLLAFNTWSSSIKPTQLLTFEQSKWIFSAAIIATFVNLAFEHFRAWRVMKRGSVAECYLDSLAVRLESIRFGNGQGWRRFLVFAELTKSKKGAEYVALFTYFSFQSWIRVLICSGPRQAVNALTLYAVYTSTLIPTDVSSFESTLGSFFSKIQTLAAENTQQAVILSGMLFTLIIWVFSVLFLLLGALFYVFFLWHYIPRQDGGLHGYCERKVNKRLKSIVTVKVNKALAKEELRRIKAEVTAAKKAGEEPPTQRQPALPSFLDLEKGDKLPEMPMLNRNDTMATLPVYTSRPGTPGSIELNTLDQIRPPPSRQTTNATSISTSSYSSRAPLVAGAADMGVDRSVSPAPTLPNIDWSNYQPIPRPGTASSNRSFGPRPQLNGMQTHSSSFSSSLPSMPERVRSPASGSNGFGGPVPYSMSRQAPAGRPPYTEGRSSPAPSTNSNRGPPSRPMFTEGRSSPAPAAYSNRGPNGSTYPARSATNPPVLAQQQRFAPQRNMTAPHPGDDYFSGNPGVNMSRRVSIMSTLTPLHSQWHSGEQAVQHMLGVHNRDNPTVHGLKQAHGYRVMSSPLVAFGTLDEYGRPWATVWGGEAGFCRPIAQNVLGVNNVVDAQFDPVMQAIYAAQSAGESADADTDANKSETEDGEGHIVNERVIRPEGGKVMAGLSIDLETRDRVKLAGRMLAAAATGTTPGLVSLQMAFAVEEALGNCPKYLNKKRITPHIPMPEIVVQGSGSGSVGELPLPQEAVNLIAKADLFFIASKHGNGSMDVNHRGGAPGFLRVFRNEKPSVDGNGEDDGDGGVTLVYPEYSGNRLYQTLGNMREDPVAGLVVPDFETGNVLYLTGRTTILVAERAAAYMPHAKLAIRVDVNEARFVRDGLPFRGSFIDYSPYNPPVRKLAAEKSAGNGEEENADASNAVAIATLLRRQVITPTISRYVFKVTPTKSKDKGGKEKGLQPWHPGQHVTFDLSSELDHGYSHMRDDDPQSLNDDFVRTFTVSAPLDPKLEIVARRHGPATALLLSWNLRVPLEIPILGFGGAEDFRMPVLWSLRAEDLALAVDLFTTTSGLGSVTKLFVTGLLDDVRDGSGLIATIKKLGAEVLERRMSKDDVLGVGEKGSRKFYCCTGPLMMKTLLQWMGGEEVVFESFEY